MLAKSSSLSMSENGSTSDGGISGVAATLAAQMVWWTPLHDVMSDVNSEESDATSMADCANVGAGKNPGKAWPCAREEACSSFGGVELSMYMAKATGMGAGTPLKCGLCRVCSVSCASSDASLDDDRGASLEDDRGEGPGVSAQCSRNDALPHL